jgi:hypothetical protein
VARAPLIRGRPELQPGLANSEPGAPHAQQNTSSTGAPSIEEQKTSASHPPEIIAPGRVAKTVKRQKPALSAVTKGGWLDATSMLEPCHEHPAAHGPGYANTPAPENIARIMNTEVDSAQTDEQDEK